MTLQGGKILAANKVCLNKLVTRLGFSPLRFAQSLTWIVAVAIAWCTISMDVAWAASTKSSNVQGQLVSEVKTIQPGTPLWVALQIKIRPGWHIYWKNPGDSGAAPKIQWTRTQGVNAGELVFPYPERLPVGPLMNFGYKDEVYLLTEINSNTSLPTNPVTLRAKADILVCKEECIPEQVTSTLTMPVNANAPAKDSNWAEAFSRTRQALPQPTPWQTSFTLDEKDLTLYVNAPSLQAGQIEQVQFFPEKDGIIQNAAPQNLKISSDGITLKIERGYQETANIVEGVLVVREKLDSKTATQAFTIQAKPKAASNSNLTAQTTDSPIWQALILALVGGIVLNLMPCVFPVLSLKALNIAQQGQHSIRQTRLQGLVFTAGVLVSFALVAGVLLILRGLGQQIGWGFQLQSPMFVLLMAYVLFAVGLSLSGVFVVGASIMGVGHSLTSRSGYAGEFFTGVLTTVMATPCTAPFMATAVSVALTQPAAVAIAILMTLGFGLALPYLLLSFTTALRRFLPKPGAWMETFQQILAFPMYAASAWLVWVLTLQAGTDGLAVALGGMILIGFAAWLHQKTQMSRQFWRRFGLVGSLVAVALAVTLTGLVQNPTPVAEPGSTNSASQTLWKPYTVEQLESLRSSRQPVFINFTASWCITCLVNERVALSQPEVMAAFQDKGVTLIKADWTNRNPNITEALSKFGRSGVPLYVFYPTGLEQQPLILPQVLTPAIVQDSLSKVS
ncbi:protein-disulfide reductase DsbD family protein [Iningainema tapete]|uniref:Thioredoxin family protein n=1 Tax=Iningainema tapete BLCC-T55 TaxID=2748662 RepID=A0A8J6XLZ6_9CYAN|nr:protein-disulfide reductase DsbD domain-containing protein [Iningainema tapete]MBD2775572.1 thioredoxin family protein [Iningainema tapete BLCC-T55]